MEVMTIVCEYGRRWIGWFVTHQVVLLDDLLYTKFLSLSDKKSVIVRPVTTFHTLREKGEIKTVSVLTRLPSSLVPRRSLNWKNG